MDGITQNDRPAWMCRGTNGLPCLVHRKVLDGTLEACAVCAPHVEKMRAAMKPREASGGGGGFVDLPPAEEKYNASDQATASK